MLTLLLLIGIAVHLSPGDHTRRLTVARRERAYRVHVPKSYDGAKPMPVVLVFHGGGSNAEQMIDFCGMNELAEREGFLAVYPSGTGQLERALTWNGGNCCGHAMRNRVDDVAFTRALLEDLAKVAKVDQRRVFATGMSNGAIMSYLLASELSDRIAAIAPVGGPMGTETCKPTRPVPVIHFHGTDDAFAPYQGGKGEKSFTGTNFYSVDHSIRAWVKANGCPERPTEVRLPDKAKDGTAVSEYHYGPGKDGAEVVLVKIEGAGHTWPGHPPRLRFLGKCTRNIDANERMWEFFKKHPRK